MENKWNKSGKVKAEWLDILEIKIYCWNEKLKT